MLKTLEISHYGPVCDVSETGLYIVETKYFSTVKVDVLFSQFDITMIKRIHSVFNHYC